MEHGRTWKFLRNDSLVVWMEIAESEAPVAQDIDPFEARDPIRMKAREGGDGM
jgi:hypothetical protein